MIRTRMFIAALGVLADKATALHEMLEDPDYSVDYDTGEIERFDTVLEGALDARNGYCKEQGLAIEDAQMDYSESEVQRDNKEAEEAEEGEG